MPYIFPPEKHPALRLPGTTGLGLRPSLACSEGAYKGKIKIQCLSVTQNLTSRRRSRPVRHWRLVESKIHDWFGITPITEGIIKPYPEYRAKTGAAGEYNPPSEDGTQPGIFYINTYQPEKMSRVDHEATLFHELIPGHHMQVALTYEDKSHHSLDKYLWNSGYGEGWALYVERLAKEMDLYSDDISLLGMLSNESMRTARLVVDPGMHVMNWTREQAVDYLKQHTACNQNMIEGEVDRYIMLPGQATSYMLGKREIETLRHLAKTRLQEQFDIRAFHDHILKDGAVSLPMLREQIQKWLETEIKSKPSQLSAAEANTFKLT